MATKRGKKRWEDRMGGRHASSDRAQVFVRGFVRPFDLNNLFDEPKASIAIKAGSLALARDWDSISHDLLKGMRIDLTVKIKDDTVEYLCKPDRLRGWVVVRLEDRPHTPSLGIGVKSGHGSAERRPSKFRRIGSRSDRLKRIAAG